MGSLGEYATWILGLIIAVAIGVIIFHFLPGAWKTWFTGFVQGMFNSLNGFMGSASS